MFPSSSSALLILSAPVPFLSASSDGPSIQWRKAEVGFKHPQCELAFTARIRRRFMFSSRSPTCSKRVCWFERPGVKPIRRHRRNPVSVEWRFAATRKVSVSVFTSDLVTEVRATIERPDSTRSHATTTGPTAVVECDSRTALRARCWPGLAQSIYRCNHVIGIDNREVGSGGVSRISHAIDFIDIELRCDRAIPRESRDNRTAPSTGRPLYRLTVCSRARGRH